MNQAQAKNFQRWYGAVGRNIKVSTETGESVSLPKTMLESIWSAALATPVTKERMVSPPKGLANALIKAINH